MTKTDYENKMTEVNGKINPIMMKIYSQGQGSMPESVPGTMPEMGSEKGSRVTVDEVD